MDPMLEGYRNSRIYSYERVIYLNNDEWHRERITPLWSPDCKQISAYYKDPQKYAEMGNGVRMVIERKMVAGHGLYAKDKTISAIISIYERNLDI